MTVLPVHHDFCIPVVAVKRCYENTRRTFLEQQRSLLKNKLNGVNIGHDVRG